MDTLRDLPYVKAVISESLRLMPPAPFATRKAAVDTVLPHGGGADGQSPIFVPAGTSVSVSIHALQRDEAVWGPDAHVFKPERWLNSAAVDWSYIPFLRGPRSCLGRDLAQTEASYVLVRLVQAFSVVMKGVRVEGKEGVIDGVDEVPDDKYVESVSLSAHCRGGTWISLIE